jgi:hypothetical protein
LAAKKSERLPGRPRQLTHHEEQQKQTPTKQKTTSNLKHRQFKTRAI